MTQPSAEYKWLRNGEIAIDEMLAAIRSAAKSVRFEMYIVHSGPVADQFREALVDARRRGLRVRALVDAVGSAYLPDSFWRPLREAGGDFRWFNPWSLHRVLIRDHRKLLVCDEESAFIGGFNIATPYRGDGIHSGWRDLGLRIRGPMAKDLAAAFDEMYNCADFKHKPFTRLRKSARTKTVAAPEAKLLLGGPGWNNPLKKALRDDLRSAQEVLIVTPYFAPTTRLRLKLMHLARTGATVRLILPRKCDLPVMRLVAQSYYRRLLAAGIEIYEYLPQILHTKLFIIGQHAYAGSANLDRRSLSINYELMVRLSNPAQVRKGREVFDELLQHCEQIELEEWRRHRTFFDRLKGRLAHFILARLDSFFSMRQLRWWNVSLEKVRHAKRHKTIEEKPD